MQLAALAKCMSRVRKYEIYRIFFSTELDNLSKSVYIQAFFYKFYKFYKHITYNRKTILEKAWQNKNHECYA